MRFNQTFCYIFMSRPHENDDNNVLFSMKPQTYENALQSGKIWKRNSEYRCRVDGSKLMRTQTFENDWSCGLSPLSFENSKMEDIDRERIVVFNWYLAPIKLVWI